MSEKKHAERHSRDNAEISGEEARVRFSLSVLKSLRKIESAVRDCDEFDPDLKVMLHDFASGKAPTVRAAISIIGSIRADTTKLMLTTEDSELKKKIGNAIDDFTTEIVGATSTSKPVSVIMPKTLGRADRQ